MQTTTCTKSTFDPTVLHMGCSNNDLRTFSMVGEESIGDPILW